MLLLGGTLPPHVGRWEAGLGGAVLSVLQLITRAEALMCCCCWGGESFLYRVPSWPLGVAWLLSDAGQVWVGGTHLWGGVVVGGELTIYRCEEGPELRCQAGCFSSYPRLSESLYLGVFEELVDPPLVLDEAVRDLQQLLPGAQAGSSVSMQQY